ncbi:protein archease, putative [Hepatocystis sp. ex Piliocolobus tephrosceles]|nr:protein archease, putative [Hepatocystis sp. ex Piliocolobus tephrosceles]
MNFDLNENKIKSLPQRDRRKVNTVSSSDENNESDYSTESLEKRTDCIDLNNKSELSIKKNASDSDSSSSISSSIIEKGSLQREYKYEYLDHTADVILHSYGNTLKESFESICIAMFNYMCNLSCIDLKKKRCIKVNGTTLEDLLFNFLNEFYFLYGSEYFICKTINIILFDLECLYIEAYGYGDIFCSHTHESGTEIKAITKHEIKIINNFSSEQNNVHSDCTNHNYENSNSNNSNNGNNKYMYEVFILVDI